MTSQMNLKRQHGFTLIELIMVIVILGILSAFALPKFADFSGDAEDSSLEGARGAVRSAAAIAHAACLADSTCNASGATSSVTLEGSAIAMVYGYPSRAGIQTAASLDGYTVNVTATASNLIVSVGGDGTPCFTYDEATSSSDAPDIGTASSLNDGADNTVGTTDDTCP